MKEDGNHLSAYSSAITKRKFLITWSMLNMAGWFVGVCIMLLLESSIKYTATFPALRTLLIWLPLGISIGVFQWLKLKQVGMDLVSWVSVTTLGFSMFVTLCNWVLSFDSPNYLQYQIPDWLIDSGFVVTILIGGAIIGGLQSIVIRRYVSVSQVWIGAYIFAPFLAYVIGSLAFAYKSILLETLFFLNLYKIALGPGKFILLYAVLVVITSITISLPTGKALIRSSLDANPGAG